jgi:hypothetical protein
MGARWASPHSQKRYPWSTPNEVQTALGDGKNNSKPWETESHSSEVNTICQVPIFTAGEPKKAQLMPGKNGVSFTQHAVRSLLMFS